MKRKKTNECLVELLKEIADRARGMVSGTTAERTIKMIELAHDLASGEYKKIEKPKQWMRQFDCLFQLHPLYSETVWPFDVDPPAKGLKFQRPDGHTA